jgi:hypothetical protein
MIYELKPEEFNKVSHLFREREIAGAHFVLNGIEKGYVLVDNISNPSIAAVIEYNSCYLDGDYSNTKFVETLIKRNIKEIDIMTAWVLNESKDTNPLLKMLNESIEYEQLNYELNLTGVKICLEIVRLEKSIRLYLIIILKIRMTY